MRLAPVLVLLLASLVGCSDGGDDDASGMPAPPEGHRWVGYAGVAVAVTDWWTTGETQCLAPVEDTVYFDIAAAADCADPAKPATVREVSALAVLDGSSGYGEKLLREMEPVGGGLLERPGCEEWFPGVCRRVFALSGTEAVFALTVVGADDGDAETIRNSIVRMPDGVTAVPLAADGHTPSWGDEPAVAKAFIAAVEAAGLTADVTHLDVDPEGQGMPASFGRGHLLDIQPQPGTPIEEGGTVEIELMGENPYSGPNR